MVSSSQPLATQAGLEILRLGGNAVDATIAVAAALAVLEPCSNGIGGDFFMLTFSAATASLSALNGSGRSPGAQNLARVRAECPLAPSAGTLPRTHGHAVTVPGAIAAWFDAVDALGSGLVPMRAILARAIDLAERGFPVSPITAHYWHGSRDMLREASPHGHELLTPTGHAPAAGTLFRRPTLARVLRKIADGGRDAFYSGWVADAIVEAVEEAGGCLQHADLSAHTSTFTAPISVEYDGVRVWEHPPNGGGLTALLALNILRELEASGRCPPWRSRVPRAGGEAHAGASASAEDADTLEAARVHAQIEALRLAYADTAYYVGDPEAVRVPVDELLSEAHARARAALFEPDRALRDVPRGAPRDESSTVSWQVVDGQGNAVSAVQSNYYGFGTGIVPAECGFSLQNRGMSFSLVDGAPNALGPGKRPYHTILPCILTDAASGELLATLTNMGGFMQPQGHVQLVCRLVRQHMCAQEAVDMPRFCVLPVHEGASVCSPSIAVECTFSRGVLDALRDRGHDLKVVSGFECYCLGRAQIIARTSDGVLWGGSDGRADGCAAPVHM